MVCELPADCANRLKTIILPGQIEPDGSQPLEIVSEEGDNLWQFTTPDGRSVGKAIEYMLPYIRDKKAWKKLPADSNVEEVIRNYFIRQPVLWVA